MCTVYKSETILSLRAWSDLIYQENSELPGPARNGNIQISFRHHFRLESIMASPINTAEPAINAIPAALGTRKMCSYHHSQSPSWASVWSHCPKESWKVVAGASLELRCTRPRLSDVRAWTRGWKYWTLDALGWRSLRKNCGQDCF